MQEVDKMSSGVSSQLSDLLKEHKTLLKKRKDSGHFCSENNVLHVSLGPALCYYPTKGTCEAPSPKLGMSKWPLLNSVQVKSADSAPLVSGHVHAAVASAPKAAWSPRGSIWAQEHSLPSSSPCPVSTISLLTKLGILPCVFLSQVWLSLICNWSISSFPWILAPELSVSRMETLKWSPGPLHGHREACPVLSRYDHRAESFPVLTV